MNLYAKVARNTLMQIAGKIISTILGLLAIAMITRYLSPSGFGEYTTITTFLAFFAVIADLGLTLVTAQMLSDSHNEESQVLNNLFGLRLVSAIFFISLAPLIVIFFPYDTAIKSGILIAAAAFFFPALNQVLIGLFQKKLSMGRDVFSEVASRLTLILVIFLSLHFKLGLNGILIATVASAAVNFILHYFLACHFITIKPEFNWSIWKNIIHKSWPLAITIILNLIYLRADTLILSVFKSNAEVGLYGAAYRVIDVLTTIPFMFAGIILPILTSAWLENNKDYFKNVLQKSFDFMAILAIPLIVGSQLLGRPVMEFVAGSAFSESGNILKYLIIAVAAIFLGTIFSHAVIALDKQKKLIWFYIFTSFSSLIAYFILIPKYSYYGAAAVTIYSEVVIAIFSLACVYKYSRFKPNLKNLAKSILAAVIMGVFIYIAPSHYQDTLGGLILIIVLAMSIYFILLYLFGAICAKDIEMIFKKDRGGHEISYDPSANL
jgi:O-antigen/teichoic acid export membrane protein